MKLVQLEPFLTTNVRNDIFQHMLSDPTREQCGVITLSGGTYRYECHDNVHETPEEHFAFSRDMQLRINIDPDVVAYVHTHPKGPNFPSEHDTRVQAAIKKPSVIASVTDNGIVEIFSFGDHLLDLDLESRDFRYGVTDCYEIWRSYVWQNEGRKMGQWPKPVPGWWDMVDDNPNMYEANFAREGYVEYLADLRNPRSEWHPRVGDITLMQLGGARVCNHTGIYLGGNLILQHRYERRSGKMPVGYMLDNHHIRIWLRHAA